MAIDYRALTRSYARKYGIPEELAIAQIGAESGFNPRAKSPAGALGIAQFMPGTARGLKVNPLDPRSALDGYGRHMSTLIRNFKGDYRKALAAYNAGAGAVQKYGGVPPYAETRGYVSKIMQQWGGPAQGGLPGGRPASALARRGGGGAAAQGGSGAAGGPGAVAPLQLDPNTQALLQRWMAVEEKALSSKGMATRQSEKLWGQLEKRLISAAQQVPAAARGQAVSNAVATTARDVGGAAAAGGAEVLGAAAVPIKAAKRFIGTPYSWGGGTPAGPTRGIGRGANTVGFDCSGLTEYAWAKRGVQIGPTTVQQIKTGRGINAKDRSQWRPGDLLFPHPGHVQMYLGGGKVIEAPFTGGKVRIVDARSSYHTVRRPG